MVSTAEPIVVADDSRRFVSRGGEKLVAALDRFELNVTGFSVLDAGASTGGFTDCVLQRGAAHVYAVDVGYGQLDQRLREDPRVSVHERTNIRSLQTSDLNEPNRPFQAVDLVTADLSFISLVLVAPILTGALVRSGGHIVALVKPQFEAGRVEVSRGKGVIRDPEIWHQALSDVTSALCASGTGIMGVMPSPITGPAGNTEFLVYGRAQSEKMAPASVSGLIDQALSEVRPTIDESSL
jgi:23S rRNA (cytidine1920-2'-O)/16S rRNA (cytidine1409-2'-O)-methyltransferase